MNLQQIKEQARKNDFNLVTKEEKELIKDRQQFDRLVQAELRKNRETGNLLEDFTPRFWHLTQYREEYDRWKKDRTVEMKAEAVNLLNEIQAAQYDQIADPELLNVKFYKAGGVPMAKYKDRFKFDAIEGETGSGANYRVHSYESSNISFLTIETKISVWDNGARVDHRNGLMVYKRENDVLTELYPHERPAKIDHKKELKKAQKYLDFKKKAAEKLEALKSECDRDILSHIENQ